MRPTAISTIALLFLLGVAAGVSTAGEFYWTDLTTNEIRSARLDGTQPQFVTGSPSAVGLAVDLVGEKVYWTDDELKKIRRANLAGSGVEDLVADDLITPRGIALDLAGFATARVAKMYWTDEGTGSIRRADLDGRNVETLVSGLSAPREIALDLLGGKMYWADSGSDRIQRANLDGSRVRNLVAKGLQLPRGIALDMRARKVYWTDGGQDKVQRANLDGSQAEEVISSGLSIVRGIALDPCAGKMYLAEAGLDKILRANLDGTKVETLLDGLPHPWSIVFPTVAPKQPKKFLRIVADVDGSDRLYIDRGGARWVHRHWKWPQRVYLNGVQWIPTESPRLNNSGPTAFLPAKVDFSSARMCCLHEGRDTAVLEVTKTGLIVHFADSPNGRANYDLTILFGK